MRIFKTHPLLKLINSYMIDSPQPSNLSYLWNFGSLLAFCLVIQIITGVTLAMHYNPSVLEAFNSVEHIMRDVNNGWLIRYLHSNTASAFFFLVYLHMGRGLYYGSYRAPRTLVWTLGTVIFLLMIVTGFLGYVLPYGQMSLWGATVITNLMSAIPWIGRDIVEFLWGGFSVNNATLNRFFALHYVLPFVLAAVALMHLIALHDSAGSGNPLGVSGNYDRLPFAPYFLFKDLITIFLFIVILSMFVFFMPNALGDSENYVMANPMQTPPAIVPEWYLLPFYAILRSIPNKLLGVIAMFSAILVILVMPFTDLSRSRGIQFRPFSKIAFYIFLANFLILMILGAKHVESPFIELGQISTVLYFSHFLIIVPVISLLENSLIELSSFSIDKRQYENVKKDNSNLLILKSAFFPLNLILKHFTLRNVIIGIFMLAFISAFKIFVLGGLFNSMSFRETILLGAFSLFFRLGITGVVEHICEGYLSEFKISNILLMNTDSGSSGSTGNTGNTGNSGNSENSGLNVVGTIPAGYGTDYETLEQERDRSRSRSQSRGANSNLLPKDDTDTESTDSEQSVRGGDSADEGFDEKDTLLRGVEREDGYTAQEWADEMRPVKNGYKLEINRIKHLTKAIDNGEVLTPEHFEMLRELDCRGENVNHINDSPEKRSEIRQELQEKLTASRLAYDGAKRSRAIALAEVREEQRIEQARLDQQRLEEEERRRVQINKEALDYINAARRSQFRLSENIRLENLRLENERLENERLENQDLENQGSNKRKYEEIEDNSDIGSSRSNKKNK
jgi:ubiquinol-cytochrome c reductase cytochrome b subunit